MSTQSSLRSCETCARRIYSSSWWAVLRQRARKRCGVMRSPAAKLSVIPHAHRWKFTQAVALDLAKGLKTCVIVAARRWRCTSAAWVHDRRISITRCSPSPATRLNRDPVQRFRCDVAAKIQDLYLAGKKQEAEAAIPQSYLDKGSLIGDEGFVRERLQALKASGVNALNVSFMGQDVAERVRTCDALRNMVDTL